MAYDKWQMLLGIVIIYRGILMGAVNIQPQYQVSIMLKGYSNIPLHMCNGVIISENIILTTASCTYLKDSEEIHPDDINIVAGETNQNVKAISVKVTSILTAKDFDLETLENDLALLQLSQSLPLGTRDDIRWVMMDDGSNSNRSCLANFFSHDTKFSSANYYLTQPINLLNNEECRNATKYPNARKKDICSTHILAQNSTCPDNKTLISDRGIGILCDSHLVGVLSYVIFNSDSNSNCTEREHKAIYTSIFPHLRWIYTILMNSNAKEYLSLPYNASTNLISRHKYQREVLTPVLNNLNDLKVSTEVNKSTANCEVEVTTAITSSVEVVTVRDTSDDWIHTRYNRTTWISTLQKDLTNSAVICAQSIKFVLICSISNIYINC